ncbi:MAG TPA: DUF3037 domain-containing protein [Gemmatimonadaceae bacterium]|nr:DUF3037 domain-containing protein [Gemmatimonadaceae bacterium]
MSANDWISYDFAVLRVVPHVHLGAFVPVGVVLHARTANFLGLRVLTERASLRSIAPGVDIELLARYLRSCQAIAEGNPDAGPLALAPPSERFHWLTAPRSDVIQPSPIHSGLARDPARELEELFGKYVEIQGSGGRVQGSGTTSE